VSGLYLAVNAAVLAVPLAFSWHPRLRFAERWCAVLPAIAIVGTGFIVWDAIFVARGIWGFESRYLLGPELAGLPVEEWLFFLCIPYACVFTYHALGVLGVDGAGSRWATGVTAFLLAVCVLLVVAYPGRAYTAVTGTLLAALLGGLLLTKPAWLGRFWISSALVIPPFVLSNGVLTGLRFWSYPVLNADPGGVEDQVVWYNGAHTVGVRLFSIPVEDVLYAILLIGLNVALVEWLSSRRRLAESRVR